MNAVLARWNSLPVDEAAEEVLPCCGSKNWARQMAARRPILTEAALLSACDEVWENLPAPDWMEAFASHPRIGEPSGPSKSEKSAGWSKQEQRKVSDATDDIRAALAEGNRAYEQRFHRTFIACATGKSAPEILQILRRRLRNDDAAELQEAAEQQRQIANLRLKKWLSP
jgi:2-oxo-4-hydroxy-4-carboxy-5-ureidoimidazoline decarboxylase